MKCTIDYNKLNKESRQIYALLENKGIRVNSQIKKYINKLKNVQYIDIMSYGIVIFESEKCFLNKLVIDNNGKCLCIKRCYD